MLKGSASRFLLEAVYPDYSTGYAGPASALPPDWVSQEPGCSLGRKHCLPKEAETFKECPCSQPHLTYERQSQAENPGDMLPSLCQRGLTETGDCGQVQSLENFLEIAGGRTRGSGYGEGGTFHTEHLSVPLPVYSVTVTVVLPGALTAFGSASRGY